MLRAEFIIEPYLQEVCAIVKLKLDRKSTMFQQDDHQNVCIGVLAMLM